MERWIEKVFEIYIVKLVLVLVLVALSEVLTDEIPLKDRLIKNGFRMYLLSFIIAPAGYLIKLMVSRELSVEDIGLVYSIIGFIGLLSAFNDLGLTEALQYYLPQYMIDKEYGKAKTILIVTWIVQFLGGILIGGLLYIGAPWMAEHYFHSPLATTILRYFCIYFLFINLFQVLQSVFTALQNVKIQYITEAIRIRCTTIIVAYIIFFKNLDIQSFTQTWVIGVMIGVVIAGFLFWWNYGKTFSNAIYTRDSQLLKTQWSYARKIMIGMQVGMIYSNIGQQFAISFLGAYQAGIWTNYNMFFTGISVFTGPIIGYLFPLFTELYKKNEQAKIRLMMKYLIYGVIVASIGIAIGGRFLSERAAVTFLTEKFRMSGILFKWSAPRFFFVIATRVIFAILSSAGYVKERMFIVILGTILTLFFSYIGIHLYGIRGLVISSCLTHIYFFLHGLRYIKKYHL